MGSFEKDHLAAMLQDPGVAESWLKAHSKPSTDDDLDRLFETFLPIQIDVVKRHCELLPGVPEVLHQLRARGIKIANTTGFDTNMMTDLIPLAAEQGYKPDLWVGRPGRRKRPPAPWMALLCRSPLGYPMSTFVKVGDTLADIDEARAAGMWAVSVVRHGNGRPF